jgi:GMP synthase (glutamine-hydrolysing)
MVVLTTGDPVPDVQASRGTWSSLIRDAAAKAHQGPVIDIDARLTLPEIPASTELVVITGSSAHVHEREPWVVRTEAWLGDLVERGVPILGICFGHQLLAQALGGECGVNPRGREFGTIDVETLETDPILEGVAKRFRANATHLDTVSVLPKGARALARSSRDDHQVIRFTSTCYGVQFHPEIDLDVMHRYFDARRPLLEAEGFDVDTHRAQATDAPDAVKILENFVQLIAKN